MVRVLIVDDQPAFRAQLCELLTRAGLVVVGEAGDIPEAEARLRMVEADLAVVDLMLPGLNGLEGTPRLKRLRPKLRVIVVSALQDRQHAMQAAAVDAGAEAYIAKDDLELARVRGWTTEAGPPDHPGVG
jgi:DNA-binding NarL/FixJ family response regulator